MAGDWTSLLEGGGTYRLAQLDDYVVLSRRRFHHAHSLDLKPATPKSQPRIFPAHGGLGCGMIHSAFRSGSAIQRDAYRSCPMPPGFFMPPHQTGYLFATKSLPTVFLPGPINSPRIPVPASCASAACIALPGPIRPISRLLRKIGK